MSGPIDLRSDTVTRPTEAMRRAMAAAAVGDDVYGEDPTVRRLEEMAAARVGKEAALFVPTGTMGNQVAVLTHTRRGDEVIVAVDSHIYDAEVGGLALLGGVQARPLESRGGRLDPAEVEAAFREDDVHYPRTGLLCLENPHNAAGGTVAPPVAVAELCDLAHSRGVPVHLDGARIFNGAVALGIEPSELAAPADSVMFCLSKSLCCPVGSLLAGPADWIARARRMRKLLGGGMRQAGILAAAGIVALETMVDRLAEDHAKARRLAEGLAGLPGMTVDFETVQTNMVYVETERPAPALCRALAARGVLAGAVAPHRVRFVTHRDVGLQQVDRALAVVAAVLRGGS
ncbi:MAG: low-specificity L-threonine aldolase [Thermoleophilia bacterium]